MINASPTIYRPHGSISQEQAGDVRARAWAYVFECFNRRKGQEGGPVLAAPDDAERSSSDGANRSIPK